MAAEYQIAQLWIGGALSYMEQLCAVSFRDAGHHVKMYTYGEVQNIPDGIEICDANEIMPLGQVIAHKRTGSPAPQADKWRYNMLAMRDHTIWADTDAYCAKPFETESGHFHGWESAHHINNGVLGLPRDSDALGELIAFTKDEYAIPDWFDADKRAEMQAARDAGSPVHVGEQSWGVWGPQALTHFLKKTGEAKYALPIDALYPISFKKRRLMLKPNLDLSQYITANTRSIHFYGRRMRMRLIEREGGEPHPDSLIGRLLKKHGIVPSEAPLPTANPHKPAAAGAARVTNAQRRGRGLTNLTDLADDLDLDQGSKKHRFTELYNMLLQPYRKRAIRLALLGLEGASEGAVLKLWRSFLPRARITVLEQRPLAPLDTAAEMQVIEAGFDSYAQACEAASAIEPPDVVLDDLTHASHHQQHGFAAIFPKLRSGGLYMIEDLRFQPRRLETSGYPRTADLFQAYLREDRFSHPDAGLEAQLNTLRLDISGCFLFQAKWHKDKRDQVLVVHKR